MVWDTKEIIHKCPFERIGTDKFNIMGRNIIRNTNNSLAFQITAKEKACEDKLEVYRTAEGLYIAIDTTKVEIEDKNNEIRTTSQLLLAETDSNAVQMAEIYKELNKE